MVRSRSAAAVTLQPDEAATAAPAAPAPVPAPALAAASAPAAAAVPPLGLRLPRAVSPPWRQRNLALHDPRANSPLATLESRLGAGMDGGGPWPEERIDDDHRRFRRGHTCIDVTPPRGEQFDPFKRSVSPQHWTTPGPEPC